MGTSSSGTSLHSGSITLNTLLRTDASLSIMLSFLLKPSKRRWCCQCQCHHSFIQKISRYNTHPATRAGREFNCFPHLAVYKPILPTSQEINLQPNNIKTLHCATEQQRIQEALAPKYSTRLYKRM